MGTMSATFEQWLEFVFNNPVRKREWYWDEDFDSRWEALELTDTLIVQYMTRLFLEPGVLRSYSLDQVEQGLWFLLGESSPGCSSKSLLRHEAALLDRVACIHAMSSFFRNFILAVTPCHFDPKAPTIGVDGVAYIVVGHFSHALLHAQSLTWAHRTRRAAVHTRKVEAWGRTP